jgi:hypothetical protein
MNRKKKNLGNIEELYQNNAVDLQIRINLTIIRLEHRGTVPLCHEFTSDVSHSDKKSAKSVAKSALKYFIYQSSFYWFT